MAEISFSDAGFCGSWEVVEKVRWTFSFAIGAKENGVITAWDWTGLDIKGFIRTGRTVDSPRGPVVLNFGTVDSGEANVWLGIGVDGFITFDMPEASVETLTAGLSYSMELYAYDHATGERVGQLGGGDVTVKRTGL